MIRKDGDVESYTEASAPTPDGQEDVTPTDMVSGAVEEIVDGIGEAFGSESPDAKNE